MFRKAELDAKRHFLLGHLVVTNNAQHTFYQMQNKFLTEEKNNCNLLNFYHKKRVPCQDIEDRGLKFCMDPCIINTHAGVKSENDPREKL